MTNKNRSCFSGCFNFSFSLSSFFRSTSRPQHKPNPDVSFDQTKSFYANFASMCSLPFKRRSEETEALANVLKRCGQLLPETSDDNKRKNYAVLSLAELAITVWEKYRNNSSTRVSLMNSFKDQISTMKNNLTLKQPIPFTSMVELPANNEPPAFKDGILYATFNNYHLWYQSKDSPKIRSISVHSLCREGLGASLSTDWNKQENREVLLTFMSNRRGTLNYLTQEQQADLEVLKEGQLPKSKSFLEQRFAVFIPFLNYAMDWDCFDLLFDNMSVALDLVKLGA